MRTSVGVAFLASVLSACGGTTNPKPSADAGVHVEGGTDAATDGGAHVEGGTDAATDGGATCSPACANSRDCCDGSCANLQNDPLNCGVCGKKCGAGTYCTGGACVAQPCETTCGSSALCCGTACCSAGQLCCDPQGPLDMGPRCLDAVDGTCPMGCAPLCICASPDTPIATPEGSRPIAELTVGDLVYSVDHGELTVVPLVRVGRTPVNHHSVMRITLHTGSVLEISPGHPTADGRSFGSLHSGDAMDGVDIDSAALVPYGHDATYDILPASDTGAYFAGGVLIGSTLAHGAQLVENPTAPSSLPLAGSAPETP